MIKRLREDGVSILLSTHEFHTVHISVIPTCHRNPVALTRKKMFLKTVIAK